MRNNWAARVTLILIAVLMLVCGVLILSNSKLFWTGTVLPEHDNSTGYSSNAKNIIITGILNEDGAALAEMITLVSFSDVHHVGAMYIPGITYVGEDLVRYGRISGAFNWGMTSEESFGITAVADCINNSLCVPVDKYLTFDMGILPKVTEILGGVNFSIENDLAFEDRVLETGELEFGSKEVLRYILSESRQNVASVNYLRSCYFEALFRKICAMDSSELMLLIWKCRKSIDTDLTIKELFSLSEYINNDTDNALEWFLIPGEICTSFGQEKLTVWSVDRISAVEKINSTIKMNSDKILVEDLLIPELTA